MKKLILAICLFTSILAVARGKPYYTYTDVQAIGGNPLVGGGMRFLGGRTSIDISGNVLPTNGFSPLIFHTKAQLLLYPVKGVYLGGGLGLLNEPETLSGVTGSLEGSFGLEWRTRQGRHFFLEASAVAPFQKPSGNALRVWPGLTFGYGF